MSSRASRSASTTSPPTPPLSTGSQNRPRPSIISEESVDGTEATSGKRRQSQELATDRERRLADKIEEQEAELQQLRALLRGSQSLHPSPPASLNTRRATPNAIEGGYVAKSMKVRPSQGSGEHHKAPSLVGHASVLYNGRMVVLGGKGKGGNATAGDGGDEEHSKGSAHGLRVWLYSVALSKWQLMACGGDLPAARHGHTASLVGTNTVLIYGGERVAACLTEGPDSPTRPTPFRNSKGERARSPPQHHRLLNSSHQPAYATHHHSDDVPLATLYTLNLATGVWAQVPPSSNGERTAAVAYHTAVVVGTNVYVYGGVESDGKCSSVLRCFNTATQLWENERPLNWQLSAEKGHERGGDHVSGSGDVPAARSHHSCVYDASLGGLVVFGGKGADGAAVNDGGAVFLYTLANKTWSRLACTGEGPSPRHSHAAFVFGGQLIVTGGVCEAASATSVADVFILNLRTAVWCPIPFDDSARVPAARGGMSVVATASRRALTLLLYGGSRVGTAVVSHELWRIDIGGKGALASLQQERDEEERQRIVERPERQPLGPPKCASSKSPRARREPIPPPQLSPPPSSGQRRPDSHHNQRPFSSQTSRRVSKQLFSAYDPQSVSMALRSGKPKSAEEIRLIVSRVSDTRVHDSKMRQLEAKYLFNPKTAKGVDRLTEEAEAESINRLYYGEVEYREERMAELDAKYYPPLAAPDMTEDDVYESVDRLYAARKVPTPTNSPLRRRNDNESHEDDEGGLRNVGGSPNRTTTVPLDATQQAMVNRLYYQQMEQSRQRRERLEQRYLWDGGGGTQQSPRKVV